MMKTYLVGYVIQPISSADKDLSDFAGKIGMGGMGVGGPKNPIFKSNKIKVDKIKLPSIYSYLAKKNNVGTGAITIMGISLLD